MKIALKIDSLGIKTTLNSAGRCIGRYITESDTQIEVLLVIFIFLGHRIPPKMVKNEGHHPYIVPPGL